MKAHFGNYDAAQGRTNAVYFNVNINIGSWKMRRNR